jgi:hypothetical protein
MDSMAPATSRPKKTLDDTAYAPAGYFGPGTHLASPSLPGLRLGVGEVFRPGPEETS